jgi:hypothetical protein
MLPNIVTITYDEDNYLLPLQARSVEKFVNPSAFDKIWIINNGLTDIQNPYTTYKDRVEILDSRELNPDIIPNSYTSQQVIKCVVSQRNSDYVLNDSKNFFIRPVDNLKPLASLYGKQGFVFRPVELDMWNNICELFEIDSNNLPLLYSTPFFVIAKYMRGMIDYIQEKTNMDIITFFNHRNSSDPTQHVFEFFLYSAYVIRLGRYADFYDMRESFVSSIWPSTIQYNHCKPEWLMATEQYIASGIHRNAWKLLGDDWKNYLCDHLELLSILEYETIILKST